MKDAAAVTSHTEVVGGAARIATTTQRWPYLASRHPLLGAGAITLVKNHFDAAAIPPDVREQLAEYAVLATPLHLFDACRYLSQAALAVSAGARNGALHFAYYAELRAALSILANAGVCILKDEHFVLSTGGGIQWFRGATHQKTWEALSAWVATTAAHERLGQSLQAFGFPLATWADVVSLTGGNAGAIFESWLGDWAFDLSSLIRDRDLRNEVSYRPDLSYPALNTVTPRDVAFLCCVSNGSSADVAGHFDVTDAALLSDFMQKACAAVHGSYEPAVFQTKMIQPVLYWAQQELGYGKDLATQLARAVKSAAYSPGMELLKFPASTNTHASGVIARAFLLVRVAIALLRDQWRLIRTSLGVAECPWQRDLLEECARNSGLLGTGEILDDTLEFDVDRRDAWERVVPVARSFDTGSTIGLFSALSHEFTEFCRFERTFVCAAMP